MSERTNISAEEALILITCACSSPDRVGALMHRAKIRAAGGQSVTHAILAHYRTRRGYDLRRFAADFRGPTPIAEMAA